MYLCSFSCKIYQGHQTVHDALEGALGVYQVRRGERGEGGSLCGWGRQSGSPVPGEAGGRGHQGCLCVVSNVVAALLCVAAPLSS